MNTLFDLINRSEEDLADVPSQTICIHMGQLETLLCHLVDDDAPSIPYYLAVYMFLTDEWDKYGRDLTL